MVATAVLTEFQLQNNFLYKPGIAGGQLAYGGTAPGELLTLQGSDTANRGRILANGGITIDWDWSSDSVTAGGIYSAKTIPASGGYIGAFMTLANIITVNNGLFILSAIDDLSQLTWTVAPGFAVETLFFARPTYRSLTPGVSPAQAFTLASQTQYRLTGAGNVSNQGYRCISFSPIIRVDSAGDQMHFGATTGLAVTPLWNTRNATAIADFGIVRGVHMINATAVGFGGQSLGSEICTDWIGLDCDSLTGLTASGRVAAVRSAILVGPNNRFLENTGGAHSDHGDGHFYFNDNRGVAFGGLGITYDAWIRWDATNNVLGMNFFLTGDDLRFSSPAANRFLISTNAGNTTGEINIDFHQGSLGAQTGANGNQFLSITQPAITPALGGDWVGVLLTQGGSFTNNGQARGRVSAWLINGISYANSSGTVTEADTFTVGGFATSSPGVTLTTRQSLNVIGGRSRFKSAMQFDPISPAALGAGDNDDWAGLLTGSANNGMRHWARISGNATTSVLTGIDATAVQDGDTFELTNVSANAIDIGHQDAASTAANRIISPTGATYQLGPDETVLIRYDSSTARWRLLGGTGA